jgi:hypothetical protein
MRRRLERVALVSGMVVASVNVWTGVPLLGLWVGAQAVGDSGLISMPAVLLAVVTMGTAGLVVVRSLAWLDVRLRHLDGRDRVVHRQLPWLRSMRGERAHHPESGPSLDALDYVLVGVVLICVAAFEVWFFFFSTSPIDGRSGRG